MGPKRSPQPGSVSANAVASGIKPSTAASSQSSTQSPLKSTSNGAAGSSSTTSASTTSSRVSGANTPTNRNTQPPTSSTASFTPPKTSTVSSTTPASTANVSSTKKPTAKGTSGTTGIAAIGDAQQVVQGIWDRYVNETPQRVKLVDTFMAFLVLLGGIQFLYCVLAGNYPFNAFLSGFSATVGQFVLTASLRMQTNPVNKSEFPVGFSDERAFADYVFGSLILHFFCVNFIN